MTPPPHLETALKHVQRIVATAMAPSPPITVREALEQITEELDLAGCGCADLRDVGRVRR
jgi:hypothetical protein